MQSLLNDLRYALRTLQQSPGFAAVAIVTLALGIGANSAIFSVVNGVVLEPLPYPDAERLVFITSAFPGQGFSQFWMSAPEYLEYREMNRSFAEVGAYNTGEVSITGGETPIRVAAAVGTASLFEALGVPAALGRTFTAQEDAPGGEPAILLSWELWRRAFGGREEIVGETIEVDNVSRTVVGVMPAGFDVHDNGIEAWTPLRLDPANPGGRASHYLYAIGRLDDGISLAAARAELETLLPQWDELFPEAHAPNPEGHPFILEPLLDEVVGDVRGALLTLLGAVGFVLLIACANVGNLLLARSESRHKEIAVRTALGAGRGRLVRQFLVESTALALLGGAVGLLVGSWGLRALLATNPDSIPRLRAIGLDSQVLLFTLGISVLTGLVFGLTPLLHLRAGQMSSALREGGERATAGSARHRLRQLLVVSEIALAVVLVMGAGLMLRSFATLQSVDPGFRTENLLTFRLYLPSQSYPQAADQVAFFRDLRSRLEALPGVEAATSMSGMPPVRRINANTMQFEGVPEDADINPNVDYWQSVSEDYFETLGIPLVEGRFFAPEDAANPAPVGVVNARLSRYYWPETGALGRRLKPWGAPDDQWITVIGIVGDVKNGGLSEPTGTELYFFVPQTAAGFGFAPRSMNFVLRTSVPPATLAADVRGTVWALDPSMPVADLRTMQEVIGGSVARPRFLTLLLGIFGAVALTLAAVGTYGVMSYSVAERSREMGIRMALGADRGGVMAMVLWGGLRLAVVGLVAGLAGAFALKRFVETLLFGVSALDPLTFVAVPGLLALVAAAACLIPAHRATRVDPIVVLKAE